MANGLSAVRNAMLYMLFFMRNLSAAQLHHSVNASSGAFHDIFRKEDFFPALSFQAVVDVH